MGKVSRIPTIGDYTIFFNSLFFVLYSAHCPQTAIAIFSSIPVELNLFLRARFGYYNLSSGLTLGVLYDANTHPRH